MKFHEPQGGLVRWLGELSGLHGDCSTVSVVCIRMLVHCPDFRQMKVSVHGL